jgi:hypothetical protein
MKKEKETKNQKKTVKLEKKRKKEKKNHTKKTASAALTGRPSVAPTWAERSSAPLTGGA